MTLPLRLYLVDDEAPALDRLQDLLSDLQEELPHHILGTASNGPDALAWLEHNPVDVLLLDIQMPQMTGIDLARHLPRLPYPPVVIFTTAYDQYALQAFDVQAADYLVKPIRATRLKAALEKAARLIPERTESGMESRRYFSVTERGRIRLIPVQEVVYLKAELKYITLRTAEREFLLEESLTHLEKELGDRFIRIHRNCLVSTTALQGFERIPVDGGEQHWVAVMKGIEEKLPVSRRQQHVIRQFRQPNAA